jgi:hypothetical protein
MTDDRLEQTATPSVAADSRPISEPADTAAAPESVTAAENTVPEPTPEATAATESVPTSESPVPEPTPEAPATAAPESIPTEPSTQAPDMTTESAVDESAAETSETPIASDALESFDSGPAADPEPVADFPEGPAAPLEVVPPTGTLAADVPAPTDAHTAGPTSAPADTPPAAPRAAEDSAPEPEIAADAESEQPATPLEAATPSPLPHRPTPGRPGAGRPGPSAHPIPAAPKPTTVHQAPAAASVPVVEPTIEPVDPHRWGRIDADGVVYVTTNAGERAIGNWQAGDAEAGLAHFGRRFDDFATEIALLEARLASGSGDPKATKSQAIALRGSIDTLAAIGDLDGAAARLDAVVAAADTAMAGAATARAEARAKAIASKEALCAEAEQLATSTQWKVAGDRFKAIVDEWRAIKGIDRKTDDGLWKRFARARDTFTRNRGSHFAELDKQRGASRETKEALIKEAEELSSSSEWSETATAYRELMTRWKSAGRAPREVEDELWERFRAAQEKFFARRNQTFSARDAEYDANAAAKEKLLAEAKQIDPDADLEAAKATLRSIQERWEVVGKVPRERMRELDGGLRAIEERVRAASDAQWRRTDPEATARVEQFRARAQSYRDQAARARAAGDERRAAEAEEQAATWEQWLETARSSVQR